MPSNSVEFGLDNFWFTALNRTFLSNAVIRIASATAHLSFVKTQHHNCTPHDSSKDIYKYRMIHVEYYNILRSPRVQH
eukprot:m.369534 g.369534  ORF g.369534 m.369534 type:complete len:78 (+) comp28122_c0_seq2:3032-3265(+)